MEDLKIETKKMENRIKILEEKIQKINERNLQVEQDKS
jgi:predicted  nucleic acid-binding Zn-ribbon protein